MALTADIIKDLVKKAIKEKYGEAKGAAINLLIFGEYGLPGLVSDAELAEKALEHESSHVGEDFLAEQALELAMDLAGAALAAVLQTAGITVVDALEIPTLFLKVLISPDKLGNDELPLEIREKFLHPPKLEESSSSTGGDDPLPTMPAQTLPEVSGSVSPTAGTGIGTTDENVDDDSMAIGSIDAKTGVETQPPISDGIPTDVITPETPVEPPVETAPAQSKPTGSHGGGGSTSHGGEGSGSGSGSSGGLGSGFGSGAQTTAGGPGDGGGGGGTHNKAPTELV